MTNRDIAYALSYLVKTAYTPPQGQQPPPADQGIPPELMALLGGGGAPPQGGGAPPAGGAPGGAPPADQSQAAGAPPADAGTPPSAPSDAELMAALGLGPGGEAAPPPPAPGGSSEAVTQLQAAVAVLREGLKQLERAVNALANPEPETKVSYYRGPFIYQTVDPSYAFYQQLLDLL